MKIVTDNLKLDLRTFGRQIDVKIKLNDVDADVDDFNSVKPSFNADLFKTIMHQVEIDSKVSMIENTKINIQVGIKLNEKNYEYINFNTYYVKTCERKEDTNSYRILAYTKMKDAMIDYDLELSEKITLRNYLIKIFQRLSWDTSNIPATFINSDKLINPALHTGIGYTFRDALDEIATISCSFILFDGDIPILLYPTNTNETIDETYLDEDNITIDEKYFINSLVFGRAEDSDNIYRKDDVSVETNGLHEYRISDNQLLSTNDRSDYIDEMFDYLKTLEFYIFDIQSKGILFLEACDIFNLSLSGVTYQVILLNSEIDIEDGLTESLYFDKPEETETNYKYADSADKKINQAYFIIDKQNKKITQLAQETTENTKKVNQIQTTVDGTVQKVSETETRLNNDYLTAEQIEAENQTIKDDIDIIKQQQTTVTTTAQGLQVQIDQINNEGVKTVKNTTVNINEAGVSVGKSNSEFSTTMNNTGTYMYAYGKQIAKYDKDGMETADLKATGEVEMGYLKLIKATVNSEKRTHIHWIGG